MNKKKLYESIMRQVSKEVKKVKKVLNENLNHCTDESYIAYKIKQSKENKQATLLYNMYIKEMKEIDMQIADVIKQFCSNPMYKRIFDRKISMLTYSLQANHADDELNLTDTTTFDDPNIIAAYQYGCTNKQLVNYGFVNDIPAWFDITWNFSEFSECTMPDFCYAVLTAISKKPGMKMELNGKNGINFIFANEMPVQNVNKTVNSINNIN